MPTLLFIGNSITDCGRRRPLGVGEGLGDGYVALVDGWLRATRPERPVRVLNMGVSGDTVRDLDGRWQRDVLDQAPDELAVMIGINDVWRRFGTRQQQRHHVPPGEYAATLDRLIAAARPVVQRLFLLNPYYIEPDHADPMRALMDLYGGIVREIAAERDAELVDTQAAFDRVLAALPPEALAQDRVHPNLTGHLVLARAFLAVYGVSVG